MYFLLLATDLLKKKGQSVLLWVAKFKKKSKMGRIIKSLGTSGIVYLIKPIVDGGHEILPCPVPTAHHD